MKKEDKFKLINHYFGLKKFDEIFLGIYSQAWKKRIKPYVEMKKVLILEVQNFVMDNSYLVPGDKKGNMEVQTF